MAETTAREQDEEIGWALLEVMGHRRHGERIQTPYGEMTTPEIVSARRSLSLAIAGDEDAAEGGIGDLVVWATIELAERLSALVEHADGAVFGAALESLAYDLGIVRETRSPPRRDPAPPPVPTPYGGRMPIPMRRSGRRRG